MAHMTVICCCPRRWHDEVVGTFPHGARRRVKCRSRHMPRSTNGRRGSKSRVLPPHRNLSKSKRPPTSMLWVGNVRTPSVVDGFVLGGVERQLAFVLAVLLITSGTLLVCSWLWIGLLTPS